MLVSIDAYSNPPDNTHNTPINHSISDPMSLFTTTTTDNGIIDAVQRALSSTPRPMDRQTFSSGLSKAPIFELSLEGLKLTHYQLTYDSRSTIQIKEFLLTDHDRYPVIKVEFERSSSTFKNPAPSPVVSSAPGGSSLPGEFSVPRSTAGGGANARVSFVPIAGTSRIL